MNWRLCVCRCMWVQKWPRQSPGTSVLVTEFILDSTFKIAYWSSILFTDITLHSFIHSFIDYNFWHQQFGFGFKSPKSPYLECKKLDLLIAGPAYDTLSSFGKQLTSNCESPPEIKMGSGSRWKRVILMQSSFFLFEKSPPCFECHTYNSISCFNMDTIRI